MNTLKREQLKIQENNVSSGERDFLKQLKKYLYDRIVDQIEEDEINLASPSPQLESYLDALLRELTSDYDIKVNHDQRHFLLSSIVDDLTGYGPITHLLEDALVTDILINGHKQVWVDKNGCLSKTNVQFDDEQHLRRFIDKVLTNENKQLDLKHPTVDARLADGSRFHAVIPPMSPEGTVVSIRRFAQKNISKQMLISSGFLNEAMMDFLALACEQGLNILISGNAGAGKTSLLNALSSFIPSNERIVTVEETRELSLQHDHVVPLISGVTSTCNSGQTDLSALIKTALRMRADRIIVGEVRGREVLDMLQAMNIGHNGSLTTIHANSAHDVLNRVQTLAMMGDSSLSHQVIQQLAASALQVVVHVMRYRDGTRRVLDLSLVQKKDSNLQLLQLFHYDKEMGAHVTNPISSDLERTLMTYGVQTPITRTTGDGQ
jgi:pilus assembly protein CpaF